MVCIADTRVYTGSGKNCPVDSTTARVALHRSACSRGYKLSREGVDPRSLRARGVCVVVLARCVRSVRGSFRCGPCLPFYSFQGEGVDGP
jgi:hypothetical protein